MSFEEEYFNLGYLDTLSYKDTFIHRLDPRTKVCATFIFILSVVSFPKYALTALLPFSLFPMLFSTLGDIPAKFILKKVLWVSPFALFVGLFNPLLDKRIVFTFYGLAISGGWVSFFSIMIKFTLTISAALLLIATTSFPGVCYALQRFGLPEIFISQLLFLYRYIFVLMEETMKIVRARSLRSFGKRGQGIQAFVSLTAILFIRTIERAERIYQAMLARGFSGKISSRKKYKFAAADAIFLLITILGCYFFRKNNLVEILGRFLTQKL